MATWLDSTHVVTAVGSDLTDDLDAGALQFWCDGVREYVEDRRPDLWTDLDGDGILETYTPTARVVAGAALLAFRLYSRRNTPLGVRGVTDSRAASVLQDDPDVARMLGVGRHRKFSFGAPRVVV